jgi:hypothetical protein
VRLSCFPNDLVLPISVQSNMKIGFQLVRPALVLAFSVGAWWIAMFWSRPDTSAYPPGTVCIAQDTSYGRPWVFGIDMSDVASDSPCNIDLWKPGFFVLDGLIWAAVVGCGAAVLIWITRIANPNC